MTSREKILAEVKANQPPVTVLPNLSVFATNSEKSIERFATVLTGIGGEVVYVSTYESIVQILHDRHGKELRIVSPVAEIQHLIKDELLNITSYHELHDVEVAILKAHFGVAENGAVWLTQDEMQFRVLPFVTQHLAVIINADAIVADLHQAYGLIGENTYDYAAFIAGPSKTADIEQSLVIGAHGPRSMTVFVLNEN